MRVLIDGHNALFALHVAGKTHEEQRHALLRLVGAMAPHATVYFDARDAPTGADSPASELGVLVKYCTDREADAAILDVVRDADDSDPRVLVVTNDRGLSGVARQHGAKTATVDEFFRAAERASEAREGDGVERGPPPGPVPRFKPSDFGLPDFVDLENYEE